MTSDTFQFTIGHILVCRRQYPYLIPAQQTATRSLLKIYGTLPMTVTMVSLIMGLWLPDSDTVVI